ncbi:leucine-rich repeat domain-containing protein [Eubacterium xylanophilum]|uniref:leucine-rich repeat domain-containing protein n=1 Tax=Eubacterium xylanophilum TaxID=39497 RepID=UPI00047873AD|nr:leucine-rich repeat domain-containing protein [Eubacterium xylanophilum]
MKKEVKKIVLIVLIMNIAICNCVSQYDVMKAETSHEIGAKSTAEPNVSSLGSAAKQTVKTVTLAKGVEARVSFNDEGCWIQKLNVEKSIRKLVLPSKIEGRTVVTVDYKSQDSPYYYEDDMTNIFGKKLEKPEDDSWSPKDIYPSNNKNIKEIVLPDSIKKIGERSFAGLVGLSKIKLPRNLEKIEAETFARCEKIKSLNIPIKVEQIDQSAFIYCKGIKSLHVSKGNKNFVKEGDFILKNDKKTVFLLAKSKNKVVVPRNASMFEDGMFSYYTPKRIGVSKSNKTLASSGNCVYKKKNGALLLAISNRSKTVNISSKVKSIKTGVIWSGKVKKIIIPKSVKALYKNWYLGLFTESSPNTVVFKGKKPPRIKLTDSESVMPSAVNVIVAKNAIKNYKKWFKLNFIKNRFDKKKKVFYIKQ